MFLHLSVILFTGVADTPRADIPQADTSPLANTPWSDTPLGRHPPGQTPLPGQTPPCSACRDTVNKRVVRILLECILVDSVIPHWHQQKRRLQLKSILANLIRLFKADYKYF